MQQQQQQQPASASACTQLGILALLAFGVVVVPHQYYYYSSLSIYSDGAGCDSTTSNNTLRGRAQIRNDYEESTTSAITGGFVHHIQTLQSLSKNSATSTRFCPCCGWSGTIFQTVPWGQVRPDGLCPQCQSCERHRRTCAILGTRPQLLQQQQQGAAFRLLHFGPQKHMEQELVKGAASTTNIDQIGLDYFAGSYKDLYSSRTLHADVSKLQLPSHFANGIIILHVLEHVPQIDDALAELKRVLVTMAVALPDEQNHQSNGDGGSSWMLVEVPYLSKDGLISVDCRDLKTDEERIACAGQADHVWAFSQSDFEQRLVNTGFLCQDIIPIVQQSLGKELTASLKLTTDNFRTIQYLCRVKNEA